MTIIKLKTEINASIEKTFNLSRDIDFHTKSAINTNEKAINGVTSGLINLNETVTWKGKHFGFYVKHTSKIIELDFPNSFTDAMIKGRFSSFKHQHIFNQEHQKTIMTDVIIYKVPYSFIGRLFDSLLLKKHLHNFMINRNQSIKKFLEKDIN